MSRRILLVDDEPAVLFAYRKVLQRHNFIVDAIETKEETIKLLEENTYDVAILDLRLSGEASEEGLDLIRYIKNHQSDTVVIMITAFGSPEIRERAYRLGADHYFEKPVSTYTIREALHTSGVIFPDAHENSMVDGAPISGLNTTFDRAAPCSDQSLQTPPR